MLTNLSFIEPGKPWPPPSEKERLKGYKENRLLFQADHATAFETSLKRVEREIGEMGIDVPTSFEVCVNYFKLISVTTAGMLFNKTPGIVAGEEDDAGAMDLVQDIADRSNLQEVLFACALDASRYGDGLLYVRRDDRGRGVIDISRPDIWFPVVDPANVRRVLYHVLATTYQTGRTVPGTDQVEENIRIEIHRKGFKEVRNHTLVNGVIGPHTKPPIMEKTGVEGFAIFPVHNVRASDQVHGIDDYNDIQSLVCELEVRIAQISRVLDKHTNPTMQGPEEALERIYNEKTGEYVEVFVPGRFFKNQSGGNQGNVSYLTWDAQLEANFKHIELLLNLIRVTSEMGALLSDISDKSGSIPSGAAMRRMLYGAISKISRLRNSFTGAIRQALVAAASLSGGSLKDKPIYIDWPDILPRDPLEQAQIADIRTGGKQTQSVKRAIMELDDFDEDDAEAELESILDEAALAMPMLEPPLFSPFKDEEEGVGDEQSS